MKASDFYRWIKANWAPTGLVMSVYFSALLLVFVRGTNFPVFLILLQTPLYMLHEAEEYVFPGGFAGFFNRDIFKLDAVDGPVDENFVFAVNIGLIWVILPVFGLLSTRSLDLGLWIPYFTVFAGVAHIALGIKARKLYNPGLIVSLVLNIPVGVLVVRYFTLSGVLANPVFNVHLLIGLATNLALPLAGAIIYRRYMRRTRQDETA
jgi:hypothetical protein